MFRSPLPPAVLAIAAFLMVVPVTGTSAASPEGGTIVTVELALKTDNGLRAHLETSEKQKVTLEIEDANRRTSYELQGEVTETGLKARFGRLGTIDVAFTPTKTLSDTSPGEGCEGAPRTLREGVFEGTIDFTGEQGYVRLEGPRAEGSMSVIPPWWCPALEGSTSFASSARLPARHSRKKRNAVSLVAGKRHCSCFFGAGVQRRRKRSIFYGVRHERREGMEIDHSVVASASASAFVFDYEKGTAVLHPPQPFSGHATYRLRPHARELWRSTIQAPLLGAETLRPDGPGFRASLYPEDFFD